MLATTTVFAAMCVPFLKSLRREAPSLYEFMGSPSVLDYIMRRQITMPFSSLILSRAYRSELALYPRSRAWASWLFIVHWLQVVTIVLFFVSLIRL